MKNKRVIYFVRHGERVDNINSDWKNTAKRPDDPFLSDRGHQQAKEVGLALKDVKIEAIFTSPFTRCLQTTVGILAARNQDLPKVYIEKGFGESLNACSNPPGYPSAEETKRILSPDENYEAVFPKALPPEDGTDYGCCGRIAYTLEEVMKKVPFGNIVIVSHGSPVAAAHLHLFKTWHYVGQCTLGKVIQEGSNFSVELWNSKNHLTDKENLRDVQTKEKSPISLPIYTGPLNMGNQ